MSPFPGLAGGTATTGVDAYAAVTGGTTVKVNSNSSLIGVADDTQMTLSGSGNIIGTVATPVDPLLGALVLHGGPTPTYAPLAGSPIVDAGDNSVLTLATDQRGESRPTSKADIGAYELQSTPPRLLSMVVGGGVFNGVTVMSIVTSLTLTFDQSVDFGSPAMDAFALELTDSSGVGLGTFVDLKTNVDGTSLGIEGSLVVLTFDGTQSEGIGGQFSLKDGRYKLTIDSNKTTSLNGSLDGDGNGTAGGNYVTSNGQIFRLFGDGDGSLSVTAIDFNAFRLFYGTSVAPGSFGAQFDFNGDGSITSIDFNEFRLRYGLSI